MGSSQISASYRFNSLCDVLSAVNKLSAEEEIICLLSYIGVCLAVKGDEKLAKATLRVRNNLMSKEDDIFGTAYA